MAKKKTIKFVSKARDLVVYYGDEDNRKAIVFTNGQYITDNHNEIEAIRKYAGTMVVEVDPTDTEADSIKAQEVVEFVRGTGEEETEESTEEAEEEGEEDEDELVVKFRSMNKKELVDYGTGFGFQKERLKKMKVDELRDLLIRKERGEDVEEPAF